MHFWHSPEGSLLEYLFPLEFQCRFIFFKKKSFHSCEFYQKGVLFMKITLNRDFSLHK